MLLGKWGFALCFVDGLVFVCSESCAHIPFDLADVLQLHKGHNADSVCDLHGQNLQVQLMSRESLEGFIRPCPPVHTWAACNRVWSSWNESAHLRCSATKWSENSDFGLGESRCPRWRRSITFRSCTKTEGKMEYEIKRSYGSIFCSMMMVELRPWAQLSIYQSICAPTLNYGNDCNKIVNTSRKTNVFKMNWERSPDIWWGL